MKKLYGIVLGVCLVCLSLNTGFVKAEEDETFYEKQFLKYDDYFYNVESNSDGSKYIRMIKYDGNDGTIKIPSLIDGTDVTCIDEGFCENKEVTSVIMGNKVTHISSHAFSGCKKLKSIKLSKNLKYIGMYAFYNCKSLESIKIPQTVTYCGKNAFAGTFKGEIKKSSYLKKLKVYGTDDAYRYKAIAKVKYKKNGKTISKSYWAERITKISTSKKKINLTKGKNYLIKTKISTKTGKRKGYLNTNILKFSTVDDKVVKIDKNGKIKALKKGKATIHVSMKTDVSLEYDVLVNVE